MNTQDLAAIRVSHDPADTFSIGEKEFIRNHLSNGDGDLRSFRKIITDLVKKESMIRIFIYDKPDVKAIITEHYMDSASGFKLYASDHLPCQFPTLEDAENCLSLHKNYEDDCDDEEDDEDEAPRKRGRPPTKGIVRRPKVDPWKEAFKDDLEDDDDDDDLPRRRPVSDLNEDEDYEDDDDDDLPRRRPVSDFNEDDYEDELIKVFGVVIGIAEKIECEGAHNFRPNKVGRDALPSDMLKMLDDCRKGWESYTNKDSAPVWHLIFNYEDGIITLIVDDSAHYGNRRRTLSIPITNLMIQTITRHR